jgi:hypothetical protein
MDWIDLAQDRNRWRALECAVMNRWFPWNSGYFLSSWGLDSFSWCLMELLSWLLLFSYNYNLCEPQQWPCNLIWHSPRPTTPRVICYTVSENTTCDVLHVIPCPTHNISCIYGWSCILYVTWHRVTSGESDSILRLAASCIGKVPARCAFPGVVRTSP